MTAGSDNEDSNYAGLGQIDPVFEEKKPGRKPTARQTLSDILRAPRVRTTTRIREAAKRLEAELKARDAANPHWWVPTAPGVRKPVENTAAYLDATIHTLDRVRKYRGKQDITAIVGGFLTSVAAQPAASNGYNLSLAKVRNAYKLGKSVLGAYEVLARQGVIEVDNNLQDIAGILRSRGYSWERKVQQVEEKLEALKGYDTLTEVEQNVLNEAIKYVDNNRTLKQEKNQDLQAMLQERLLNYTIGAPIKSTVHVVPSATYAAQIQAAQEEREAVKPAVEAPIIEAVAPAQKVYEKVVEPEATQPVYDLTAAAQNVGAAVQPEEPVQEVVMRAPVVAAPAAPRTQGPSVEEQIAQLVAQQSSVARAIERRPHEGMPYSLSGCDMVAPVTDTNTPRVEEPAAQQIDVPKEPVYKAPAPKGEEEVRPKPQLRVVAPLEKKAQPQAAQQRAQPEESKPNLPLLQRVAGAAWRKTKEHAMPLVLAASTLLMAYGAEQAQETALEHTIVAQAELEPTTTFTNTAAYAIVLSERRMTQDLGLGAMPRLPLKAAAEKIFSGVYNRLHPIKKTRRAHRGNDVRAARGTPLYSILTEGEACVEWAGDAGIRATMWSDDTMVKVTYMHMNEIIKPFQRSRCRDISDLEDGIVGAVGSTGLSTGPHLHLEIELDGEIINDIVEQGIIAYEVLFPEIIRPRYANGTFVEPGQLNPGTMYTVDPHPILEIIAAEGELPYRVVAQPQATTITGQTKILQAEMTVKGNGVESIPYDATEIVVPQASFTVNTTPYFTNSVAPMGVETARVVFVE